MKARRWLAVTLTLAVGVVLSAPPAWAIPAFARKYNLVCSSCHTAMPYLNATGRSFKEAGWRMPDEDGEVDVEEQPSQEVSKSLWLDKVMPLSIRVRGNPIDKQDGEDVKLRAFHEIALLSAGNFWKSGSFFIEIEGEDEEGFELVAEGEVGWHPHRAANFKLGFGSVFHTDPYNSLTNGMRLTVSPKIPLIVGGAFDARFGAGAQFASVYGRTKGYGKKNALFYSFGVSAGNGNPEGENPQDFLGRVAFDFTPDLMIGGFYYGGKRDIDEQEIDLSRWGLDLNLRFDDWNVLGLFMNAEEDFAGAGKQSNVAGYLEAFYTLKRGGRPFFVPLVRYDWTELNDGRDTLAAITAQIGFYVIENAKVAIEHYNEIDVPSDVEKRSRTTLLFDIAF